MPVDRACWWGLLGVVLIEAYALRAAVTAVGGARWPWVDEQGRRVVAGYAVAVACRMVMGVGLNAVYAAAHQIAGPLAAVTMGIAAPLILQHMAAQRPEAPGTTVPTQAHVPAPEGRVEAGVPGSGRPAVEYEDGSRDAR